MIILFLAINGSNRFRAKVKTYMYLLVANMK